MTASEWQAAHPSIWTDLAAGEDAVLQQDVSEGNGGHYRVIFADGPVEITEYVFRRQANEAFAKAHGVARWSDVA